ncbi:aldose 1-epimerase [Pseudomonas lundensis]|uniref:aldose 1-epimerase n=1 Tax=Serratia proteamaculans TaxID=28151 RepID=UPI0029825C9A|nr:aldose 1-epimerase [Serratia proteamaculans]MDW5500172.1 aldose 1-epimerase [Serratia proteamaculans]MDW5505238.1 aldose 1-epimerase [Pseudomonas lundensis]
MALFTLDNGSLSLVVSSLGGSVLKLAAHSAEGEIPLLRPAPLDETTPALQAGCFPLVPFGNRVNHNRFSFEGRDYRLSANTDWDRHYLHGDGWLQQWQCIEQRSDFLRLRYQHTEGHYQYRVDQCFTLDRQQLRIELLVEHIGESPMPYGLGWHPYFPLTPHTQVQASAQAYWLEAEEWLAGEQVALSEGMDFNRLAELPRRWVNNGFGGWNGEATIQWPEQGSQLQMSTEPACPVYFMFISDPAFDPGYQFEFFCLEPMSHAANGHNLAGLGGLRRLAKGESFSQSLLLSYSAL